ncbi:Nse4-domain-containing protein [Paraphaeosphaeria sporulosa]|uniref:Non-structural maintenance of chromosomes element 4 n=1 Tax=Paraphaeosphaeria sporulosa TaxID=1460663 RepID=A0A177BYN1_9PLEO|nr:Nse4-domain-containing protein [Paraphaeosphaeria sporulosa]OAF99449.1 Nse4-domain-containing protein [Paraphaeosphaeria sporulosa]
MARLNTHTSATPLRSRATTVDTLYRDPTPAGRGSTARTSSYSVMSPALSQSSDKENDIPESRQNTPSPASKRGSMAGTRAQRLPTPDSASTSNPNKRLRTSKYDSANSELRGSAAAGIGIYEDGQENEEDAEEEDDFEQALPTPTDAELEDADGQDETEDPELPAPEDDDDDPDMRYYNPQQDPRKRRQIRSNYRNLQRELEDNRDEYIKPNSNRLNELVPQATRVFSKVRMTADAVLDSHFLTSVTDLSSKQLKNSVNQGNHGIGVDLDQFVSRCIFFMKEGRPPGAQEDAQPSSRRPRQMQVDEADEEGDGDGEGLDWAYLGRHACFPSNSRPPLSSFLLGPLSVQKRVRNMTRRARAQRQPAGPATRPQEIKLSEMDKSENSNLTHQVKTVGERLKDHLNRASELVTNELELLTSDPTDDEMGDVFRRHRVCALESEEAAVSLFDFAINPHSFGQTVENLFYISFLIREGAAKVETDADGLPLLAPEASTADQRREQNVEVQRRQAVFSIDYATWRTLIEAFDIKEPLIPHRAPEQTNIGASGWYS